MATIVEELIANERRLLRRIDGLLAKNFMEAAKDTCVRARRGDTVLLTIPRLTPEQRRSITKQMRRLQAITGVHVIGIEDSFAFAKCQASRKSR